MQTIILNSRFLFKGFDLVYYFRVYSVGFVAKYSEKNAEYTIHFAYIGKFCRIKIINICFLTQYIQKVCRNDKLRLFFYVCILDLSNMKKETKYNPYMNTIWIIVHL